MAACLWAGLMVAAALFTDSPVLRTALGVPLVFLIVGHTVLRAVGIPTVTLTQHLTYSVGASLASCILGGFALHFAHGLNPIGWAIWMWGVTALATVIAGIRRTTPALPPRLSVIPGFRLWHGLALTASVLIVVGAFALAVDQEENHREFRYTEFWIVPQEGSGELVVGIRSAETKGQVFDVEVTLDNRPFATYRGLVIEPGETWTHNIPVLITDAPQKAEARLFRPQDNVIYRHVSALVPGT
ncbi:hypothetical protein [Methylobacterium nodulans]|nr:hypothetical protein [Methylobacterium nodulans]